MANQAPRIAVCRHHRRQGVRAFEKHPLATPTIDGGTSSKDPGHDRHRDKVLIADPGLNLGAEVLDFDDRGIVGRRHLPRCARLERARTEDLGHRRWVLGRIVGKASPLLDAVCPHVFVGRRKLRSHQYTARLHERFRLRENSALPTRVRHWRQRNSGAHSGPVAGGVNVAFSCPDPRRSGGIVRRVVDHHGRNVIERKLGEPKAEQENDRQRDQCFEKDASSTRNTHDRVILSLALESPQDAPDKANKRPDARTDDRLPGKGSQHGASQLGIVDELPCIGGYRDRQSDRESGTEGNPDAMNTCDG